jgi:HYDIN/CFA65/VesB family protein
MKNRLLLKIAGLSVLSILFFFGQPLCAGEDPAPVIYFEETTHQFPAVFEGTDLSHTFTVFNKGSADLEIKEIKPT